MDTDKLKLAIETVKDFMFNTMGMQAYQIDAIGELLDLARQVLEVGEAMEPKKDEIIHTNPEFARGYNLRADEDIAWVAKKLEGIGEIIHEHSPIIDEEEEIALALALKQHFLMKGNCESTNRG